VNKRILLGNGERMTNKKCYGERETERYKERGERRKIERETERE